MIIIYFTQVLRKNKTSISKIIYFMQILFKNNNNIKKHLELATVNTLVSVTLSNIWNLYFYSVYITIKI